MTFNEAKASGRRARPIGFGLSYKNLSDPELQLRICHIDGEWELEPEDCSTEPSMSLGELVKYQRKCLGLSQKELADRIRRHVTYVSKIESGTFIPPIRMLELLAGMLQVPRQTLFQKCITVSGRTGDDIRAIGALSSLTEEEKQILIRGMQ